MGGKGSKESLDDTIFNLRFASKQMNRESQRSEKQQRAEKLKAQRALERGMVDNARIFAQNAIRKHGESLNYLRLASKLDAVSSKIQSAYRTQDLTRQFGKMVPQINVALRNMDLEKISTTMEQFERTFENLDVATGTINQALQSTTSVSAPVSQVDDLLGQIAAEHNIQVQAQLGEVPLAAPVQHQSNLNQEEEFKQRMARFG